MRVCIWLALLGASVYLGVIGIAVCAGLGLTWEGLVLFDSVRHRK